MKSEELELQRHEQTVILHTTKPCWDVSQGFRCKVKTNGTKLSYKAIPKKKTIVIYKCCPGYFETPLETCENGYYGNNCSLHCNCTETEICNKVVGCCGSSNKQCSDLQSAAMKEFVENRNWMFPILLSSLLAVVLLSFGTFFYRRKYKKEKDPELPTLTYYPHVKELFTPNEVETREFNNPMYPGANERLSIKEIPDEPVLDAKRVELRNSTSTLSTSYLLNIDTD
ncbi:unnamed protein product [Thelazia callipaeda]|uniref:EMI domain-containing protein n=1 Tax=Thelazia callipaeda TaxID=103827 RepID=A0A158RAY7_THECL|nr:unnamed protein product [Thelazia callipaeda]